MGQTITDAVDAGFNVVILAFIVNGAPADMGLVWSSTSYLNAEDPDTPGVTYRQNILNHVHAKGGVVLVSTGGSTEGQFWEKDATEYGTDVAQWAKLNELDGVDFDLENIDKGFCGGADFSAQQMIEWLVTASKAARAVLGPHAIISHAPQQPYFGVIGKNNTWAGPTGGYTAVGQATLATGIVDFFNVQAYNQGSTSYTTYQSIFVESTADWPYSAFFQLAPNLDVNKLVLGKPFGPADAGSGYLSAEALHDIFDQAESAGWHGGVMTWQWPSRSSTDVQDATAWLDTIFNN